MRIGKRSKSETVLDSKLSEHRGKVVPYCGLGNAQLLRDLLIPKTAAYQRNKLLLSAGKLLDTMSGIRHSRRHCGN